MTERDSGISINESLRRKQVGRFTYDTLRAKEGPNLINPSQLINSRTDWQILSIDLGGSKATGALVTIGNGMEIHRDTLTVLKSRNGEGYRQFLEQMTKIAQNGSLPVGISTTGIVEGSRLIKSSYLQRLLKDMEDIDCDFARVFPNSKLAVLNDAVAGSVSAYAESIKRFPNVKEIIFLINGSGLGGAIASSEHRYSLEPGHVEVVDELNPYKRKGICSITRQETSCMHLVTSGIGIEDTYFAKTGKRMQGENLADNARHGDKIAQDILNWSSYMVAVTIEGIMSAFNINPISSESAVVCHGGVFEMEEYREMIISNLNDNLHSLPNLLFTKDISPNACLDGATIAAITS